MLWRHAWFGGPSNDYINDKRGTNHYAFVSQASSDFISLVVTLGLLGQMFLVTTFDESPKSLSTGIQAFRWYLVGVVESILHQLLTTFGSSSGVFAPFGISVILVNIPNDDGISSVHKARLIEPILGQQLLAFLFGQLLNERGTLQDIVAPGMFGTQGSMFRAMIVRTARQTGLHHTILGGAAFLTQGALDGDLFRLDQAFLGRRCFF